jgi:hypothetical protein
MKIDDKVLWVDCVGRPYSIDDEGKLQATTWYGEGTIIKINKKTVRVKTLSGEELTIDKEDICQ